MRTRSTIRLAAAAASTIAAALVATTTDAGASPWPSPTASCVATVTVAETRIAPGFVGEEVRSIAALGPGALSSVVRALAGAHLADLEACAALVGE
jgi:hypothetical protein